MSDETKAGPISPDAPAQDEVEREQQAGLAVPADHVSEDAPDEDALAASNADVLANPAAPIAPATSAGEAARFSAEYDTTLELLTSYVDLLVGPKQRRFALVMSVIDVVLAVIVALAASSLWPVALVLFALGIGMLWYRTNICRLTASKMMRGLDPAEMHRHVHVFDDRVTLVKGDGSTEDFPLAKLTDVPHNDTLLVLAFGRSGVTVPNGSLTAGTYEDLLAWAREQTAGEGSSAR